MENFERACLLRAGVCQAVLWGRNIQPNQTLISMINYYDKTQLLTKKNFPLPPYGGLAGWAMAEMGYISGISGPILKIIFFTEKH